MIHLNSSNVAVFHSAPAISRYTAFKAIYDSASREPQVFQSHLIPPDDEEETDDTAKPLGSATGHDPTVEQPDEASQQSGDQEKIGSSPRNSPRAQDEHKPDIMQTSFLGPNQDPTTKQQQIPVIEDEFSPTIEDPTRELLMWHYRLGHISF